MSRNFELVAVPHVHDAYCDCGERLHETGIFNKYMVCIKCENVYELKLVKMRKNRINKETLKEVVAKLREKYAKNTGQNKRT